MTSKIHHFKTTVEAYDATQTSDHITKGDVLIIEDEGVVGLADTWPIAVTRWPGELHGIEVGYTLEKLGFTNESIALALDAAKTLGFPTHDFNPDADRGLLSIAKENLDRDVDQAFECLDACVQARAAAELKAWKSLAGYKFEMFGYWASSWVKYNQLLPKALRTGNPFKRAVDLARAVL